MSSSAPGVRFSTPGAVHRNGDILDSPPLGDYQDLELDTEGRVSVLVF